MKITRRNLLSGLFALPFLFACAQMGGNAGVQRMYVINCGENRTNDLSRWTPGLNEGKAWVFSNHCYLIQHARGWMLWDTGISDLVAASPNGVTTANGLINARMPKPLSESLRELGVAPGAIKYLAMSHLHADHCGNANLFTAATLYMQENEYNAAFGPEPQKFNFVASNFEKLRASPAVKLKGDHDVFGDGSVVIKSAPGHTLGHQTLLVRLPKAGPVLLSGDMAHLQDNWEQQRVPSMNFNKDQSTQSMQSMRAFIAQTGAQLWINHDMAQSSRIPKAPAYVE
ncbi:MAG: N-acyl homoserine lactonase family protein [Betaproteobacteria bacterium]|nr:N-acyl homoserine lactonase family protein [Betaproteobacteria bacterium]